LLRALFVWPRGRVQASYVRDDDLSANLHMGFRDHADR
jgi:hypothetical protein